MNQILLPPFSGVVLTRVNQLAVWRALEQILAGIVHSTVGCPRNDRRTDVVQLTLAMSIPVVIIFLIFQRTLLDRMMFGAVNE